MFALVYKFTVKEGMESAFQDAWSKLTQAIYAAHGSLGSRLHRGNGNTWFAYAQWPSRQAWLRAAEAPSADADAAERMKACLDGPVETLSGEVSKDLLP